MANIQGLQEFQRRLRKIGASPTGDAGKVLFRIATQIKNEAVRRTPIKTGALRESAAVDDPIIASDETKVIIRFWGETAGYAIYVHEDLSAHHSRGQAKFLETAVEDSAPFIAEKIAYELYKLWQES